MFYKYTRTDGTTLIVTKHKLDYFYLWHKQLHTYTKRFILSECVELNEIDRILYQNEIELLEQAITRWKYNSLRYE